MPRWCKIKPMKNLNMLFIMMVCYSDDGIDDDDHGDDDSQRGDWWWWPWWWWWWWIVFHLSFFISLSICHIIHPSIYPYRWSYRWLSLWHQPSNIIIIELDRRYFNSVMYICMYEQQLWCNGKLRNNIIIIAF